MKTVSLRILLLLASAIGLTVASIAKYDRIDDILLPPTSNRINDALAPNKLVGILTLDLTPKIQDDMKGKLANYFGLNRTEPMSFFSRSSYFPKSYVTWLRQFGITVIPVDINKSPEYLYALLDKIDGLLLTGGASPIYEKVAEVQTDGTVVERYQIAKPSFYTDKVMTIVKYIKEINKERKFAIWGTCLGLESLLTSESDYSLVLDTVNNENYNSNISLSKPNALTIGGAFNDQAKLTMMEEKPLFYFNHDYGFYYENFTSNQKIKDQYEIVATTQTRAGRQIVAFVKHRQFPFYAVQYHPEKIQFEHNPDVSVGKSEEAIDIAVQHAKLFTDQVQAKSRTQADIDELMNALNSEVEVFAIGPLGVFDIVYLFWNKMSPDLGPNLAL